MTVLLRHALFPISLSNHQYSTKLIESALEKLLNEYDEITFLLADKIHLYNTCLRTFLNWQNSQVGSTDICIFRSESSLEGILQERKNWLRKVIARLGRKAARVRWNMLSLGDVSDSTAFAIQRRVNILALLDQNLRRDIRTAADAYTIKRLGVSESIYCSVAERYIIEEIAFSIRIKVVGEIHDEFYIGEQLRPVVDLYQNRYLASPWQLAGMSPRSNVNFRFFDSVTDSGVWSEIVN